MKARKQESERGTRHGLVFEDAVFGFVSERSQEAADIAERTGNTTGLIKNNKKGDMVIELGPEAASAGARIVVEAKEDASYNLKKALEEMEEARKNRSASIGVFVFSKRTAPSGLEVFNRYGNDVVVIWDAEDTGATYFLMLAFRLPGLFVHGPNPLAKKWTQTLRLWKRPFWKLDGKPTGWMKSPSPQRLFAVATIKLLTAPAS